ncbi:MAG: hypothetical protein HYX76_14370 [Acidobacteria bacterium]|nr:hypothetical protein [Acidobacteriota bacterium]
MQLVVALIVTFLIAVALTIAVRTFARRRGIVAKPRQDRWHQEPTALLGGVAICGAFAIGYLLFAPAVAGARLILLAGTLLFAVGVVDDLIQVKPYVKLVFQLVAAAGIVYFRLVLPWTTSTAINDLLTIFWLVGITNAINLLDNMDGLAGGIAFIACLSLMITFQLSGQSGEAVLAMLLAGAVLGFLVFNFHPASIFMGDGGALFLGFVLGGLSLVSDYGRSRNLAAVFLTPVLILLLPIFDTCLVTVTRKLSGRPASQGGRDHSSHRLVALGVSERQAVLTMYVVAAFSGGLAIVVRLIGTEVLFALIPAFAVAFVLVGVYLGKVRIEAEGAAPPHAVINAIANFSYKRRVFEILLDVVLVVLAYYGAYLLRFDPPFPPMQIRIFAQTVPLVIVAQMLFFLWGGVYSGIWSYVGMDDLIVIARSVVGGTAASACLIFPLYGYRGPSGAVFVLDALLLLVLIGGTRASFRLLRSVIVRTRVHHPDSKPVVIYGAGDAGAILVRELMNNPSYRYVPIGFIDDDKRKAGRLLHGCRIFPRAKLPDLIRAHGVNDILISSAKVPESVLDDLRGFGLRTRKMSIHIE